MLAVVAGPPPVQRVAPGGVVDFDDERGTMNALRPVLAENDDGGCPRLDDRLDRHGSEVFVKISHLVVPQALDSDSPSPVQAGQSLQGPAGP